MPEDIGRRGFVQRASVGAVAVGAVAAGGARLLGGAGAAGRSAVRAAPDASGPGAAPLEGSGVIAQVVDARKGLISILVGSREVKYTDREMAQRLLRAAQ